MIKNDNIMIKALNVMVINTSQFPLWLQEGVSVGDDSDVFQDISIHSERRKF